MTQESLHRVLREIIEAEATSGWAILKAVPSTYTWKAVDYVSRLDRNDQLALFEALRASALFLFQPAPDPGAHPYTAGHPGYRAFVDAMPGIWDWKYASVRTLRGILGELRSTRAGKRGRNYPRSVIEQAESIQPTTASQIRRKVRWSFAERFGCRPENLGGGEWRYHCAHEGRKFEVVIDYGGMQDQLRYGVEYEDSGSGIRAKGLSYERLIGLGFGQWDFVTAANLDGAVELLSSLVEKLVELPERVRGERAV